MEQDIKSIKAYIDVEKEMIPVIITNKVSQELSANSQATTSTAATSSTANNISNDQTATRPVVMPATAAAPPPPAPSNTLPIKRCSVPLTRIDADLQLSGKRRRAPMPARFRNGAASKQDKNTSDDPDDIRAVVLAPVIVRHGGQDFQIVEETIVNANINNPDDDEPMLDSNALDPLLDVHEIIAVDDVEDDLPISAGLFDELSDYQLITQTEEEAAQGLVLEIGEKDAGRYAEHEESYANFNPWDNFHVKSVADFVSKNFVLGQDEKLRENLVSEIKKSRRCKFKKNIFVQGRNIFY